MAKGKGKGSKKGGKIKVKVNPAEEKARKREQALKAKKAIENKMFPARPRDFSIGQDILPKRDLTRFVKWPKYVRLQRQERVLIKRLKVPPSINQFTQTVDKATATQLFKLLQKYKPEDKAQKKQRLRKLAEEKAAKDTANVGDKPVVLKYGLNHVTALIEQRKARLVVIAHDVDPIELVVFLPALCRKLDVPYCIVKGKSRLGQLVHHKKATCVALTDVRPKDEEAFRKLVDTLNTGYKNRFDEIRRSWGGQQLGPKTVHRLRAAAIKKERAAAAIRM
ncbi:ribosomal protein L7A [Salpingoeca rosetta]|uniref:60S ribosomal protein L7a n=1 Tax=Salpingoeca rosetta (strain ATCC 50818 / BSB-021) TaxID=946362 RepID=F2UI08_SALR5|nr:ribosomal protein L7A [Salpingoeca rosetta]EGD76757.1 ribosomal protein L7A [Salpingoeca rosetta]|eukprot:XP_004991129.1 ribosomal protein L7A [Salpingoeca rosetta]